MRMHKEPDSEGKMRGRGWYSRGYLPHFDDPDKIQFITWRLIDSLPKQLVLKIENDLKNLNLDQTERERAYRKQIEALLDRNCGHCWLRYDACAEAVVRALFETDGFTHEVHSWVVMPNHVHVLVKFTGEVAMGDMVEVWKAASAKEINAYLRRSGSVWQEEYLDRYSRDQYHYDNTKRYIELNPVRGGLVSNPGKGKWSSALR